MKKNEGIIMHKMMKKFRRALLISLILIMSISMLSTFILANEDNTTINYSVTDTNVISMDLVTHPVDTDEYRSPMESYNDSIKSTIEERVNYYTDSYKPYLLSTYPELDTKQIDEFVDTIRTYNAEVENSYIEFQRKYESNGYTDAYLLSEQLTVIYNYNYKKYDYVSTFVNTYGDYYREQYDEEINEFFLSFLDYGISYIRFMGYLDFGYSIGTDPESQIENITAVYDEIYQQVSYIEDDPVKIDKKVADILKQSVEEWVYEVNIDYFKAYQAQVSLYLQNAKEIGYVYDLHGKTIGLKWNTVNSRELILGDFIDDSYIVGSLSPEFLAANLNSDGTAFVSPEEVYKHPFIQSIIEETITPCLVPTDSTDTTFYEKENYILSVCSAIENQYYSISMPGGHYQPILQAFNYHIVNPARDSYYFQNYKLPEITTWIPEGQEITVYDQYRLLNYIKVPSVDLKEDITETVARTIHYEFEDGTQASPDVVQSVNFSTIKELISGKEIVDVDTQTLSSLENPNVVYPQTDVTVLKPKNSVDAVDVNKDTADSEITIVYPLEFMLEVSYVDENGISLADTIEINGRWNTQYSEKAVKIDGYELTQIPANASGVFGTNRENVTFVYKKVVEPEEEKPSVTPSEPEEEKSNQTIPSTSTSDSSQKSSVSKSPSTGDNTMIFTWIALLGISMMLMGYIIRSKKR